MNKNQISTQPEMPTEVKDLGEIVSRLVSGCPHDPRTLAGMPIGQYHCPECGEMVIAGLPHDPEPPTHMPRMTGTNQH